MSTRIKYTPAELLSFEMVPPTCDEIDNAVDRARRQYDEDLAKHIVGGYNLPTDDRTMRVIREVYVAQMFHTLKTVTDVATLDGTFRLRLALVKMIEKQLGGNQPISNYQRWVDDHESMMAYRKRKAEEAASVTA